VSLPEDLARALAWAEESLETAQVILDSGRPAFAVTRAYYAMFYAAQALLSGMGLDFAKHSAVMSRFGREFAKTGILPAELHRYLMDAFDARSDADYRFGGDLTEADAQMHISHAIEFLAAAREYLERKYPDEGR